MGKRSPHPGGGLAAFPGTNAGIKDIPETNKKTSDV